MKTLLISVNTEEINMPVLPLGLAYVAAAAENAGHAISVLNLTDPKKWRLQLTGAIEENRPDVIGVSVRNIDDQSIEEKRMLLDPVKEVIDVCREATGVPVVVGGAGYSIFPERVLTFLGADIGIQGDGEQAFVSLLNHFKSNTDISGIPGLRFPEKGGFTPPVRDRNLNRLMLPRADVHVKIPADYHGRDVFFPFQTRRGCPMDCIYCSTSSIEGRLIRKTSPDKIVSSLTDYVRAGVDKFFFVDNIFNLPPAYARQICEKIIASGIDIRFRCIIYPRNVDEKLAELIYRAGGRDVALGFESGSDKMLKALGKRFTTQDVRRISEIFGRQGVNRMGFLMLGAPGETRETVLESLEFAGSLDLEMVKLTAGVRIYPHTKLAQIAREKGIIEPEDDLFFPKFYMEPGLEDFILQTVEEWTKERPNWNT